MRRKPEKYRQDNEELMRSKPQKKSRDIKNKIMLKV